MGTKFSHGDTDVETNEETNLETNSPVIPMLCPRWTNCPQGQFCLQWTILSPMDNILEFCTFVNCIAKFVPLYWDKFGDITKIQFCPKYDLSSYSIV